MFDFILEFVILRLNDCFRRGSYDVENLNSDYYVLVFCWSSLCFIRISLGIFLSVLVIVLEMRYIFFVFGLLRYEMKGFIIGYKILKLMNCIGDINFDFFLMVVMLFFYFWLRIIYGFSILL